MRKYKNPSTRIRRVVRSTGLFKEKKKTVPEKFKWRDRFQTKIGSVKKKSTKRQKKCGNYEINLIHSSKLTQEV